MSEILPIESLNENQSGRIVEIVGPLSWQHRLEELGLCTGNLVRLVKRGEPCLVAVNDQRLSLRCESGAMILVETLPTEVRSASLPTSHSNVLPQC